MEKQALYYERLKDNIVKCNLCPIFCVIKNGNYGNCNARQNIDGELISMVYGNISGIAIDPIEKKPLYHFMPGSSVFSIGTNGCNLHCKFCQNWETSQNKPDKKYSKELTPQDVVNKAEQAKCKIIAYTYNEPTIFFEFMLETARLAKKKGLKNIMVSNGFINPEPLRELIPFLDAANIDLKSIDNDFYKKYCGANVLPILATLKTLHKAKVHIEITNLIIPGLNDNKDDIGNMCKWICSNVGSDVPLHFSASYPCYKMLDTFPTPLSTLTNAKRIAEKNKINYVYIGNVAGVDSNTYCHKCKERVIDRENYSASKIDIKEGKCKFCGNAIHGVFE